MALNLIYSNKIEHLHSTLNALIKDNPLSDPFQKETVICPSAAMARWVNVQFSIKQGIAANYDYPLPAKWVWSLASQLLEDIPNHDALEHSQLSWLIFALIKKDKLSEFKELYQYLNKDENDLKLWTLSNYIALAFDRYLNYRPELIKAWDQGQDSHWQAHLWREISRTGVLHRVQLMQQLMKRIDSQGAQSLPVRISVFAVSALPPLFLHFLQELSKHIDVYFFILSPSQHYWSDCVSLKQLAKQRLKAPDLSDYYSQGHELLSTWGRQAKIFQDTLLNELDDEQSHHHEMYDSFFPSHLLGQVQQAIFNLQEVPQTIPLDESIVILKCHSALRECEALHDQLLKLLQKESISPEDILVMVPDIDRYAPMIETVFSKQSHASKTTFIPWNMSDADTQSANDLVNTFYHLLKLSNARFNVTEIEAFFDCHELLMQFNIDAEDIDVIKHYIHQASVHWGMSAQHKQDLGLPNIAQNTWLDAQQRFFVHYAIDEHDCYQGITPLNGFTGSRAETLAKFYYLLDQVFYWSQRLSSARTLQDWQSDINEALFQLFTESESVQLIRDAIDDWLLVDSNQLSLLSGGSVLISQNVLLAGLNERLSQNMQARRYFSGGVTFCGLKPMRSVPFKVIAMIGLNEHDFPRKQTTVEFDLTRQHWQHGDVLAGDEDRYLFLETLLCAREHLILSYTGKSIKDNSDKPASLLVNEFCEYIDEQFILDNNKNTKLSERITYNTSMQAFSPKNFSGVSPSYNDYWLRISQALVSKEKKQPILGQYEYPIPSEMPKYLELNQLIKVLKEPLKSYYQHTLNIQFYEDTQHEDEEVFNLDSLQKWSVNSLLMAQHLKLDEDLQLNSVSELLPHGTHADLVLSELTQQVEQQLAGLEDYINIKAEKLIIDLSLNEHIVLQGGIDHYYPSKGLLHVSPSSFSAKLLIPIWIQHVVLCSLDIFKAEDHSVLVCKEERYVWSKIDQDTANEYLLEILTLYQECLRQPLPLFTKNSFIYQQCLQSDKPEQALEKAINAWNGSNFHEATKGEKTLDYVRMAFAHYLDAPNDILETEPFKTLSERLYAKALQHMQEWKV